MTRLAGRHAGAARRAAPAPAPAPRRRHRRLRPVSKRGAVAVLLCGLLAVGVGACGLAVAQSHPGHAAMPVGKPTLLPVPKGRAAPVPQPSDGEKVAGPVSLTIPSIGVKTRLTKLGVTASGALQVPASTAVAGWYTFSPRPGAIGSSIIAGHIDSLLGPGIFYNLRQMKLGKRIFVRRADRSLAIFRVTAKHTYLKSDFPTADVYGPTPTPQLRLITCGGTFDSATGHYLSNVIVFATLVSRHGRN
jgi:sortase (surface protein transpeptidase)